MRGTLSQDHLTNNVIAHIHSQYNFVVWLAKGGVKMTPAIQPDFSP